MLPPTTELASTIALQSGLVPRGSRVTIFEEIYWVFLVLGTLVGVVVIGYMLYNAYTYREDTAPEADIERPTLGEIPTGGGGGKKLFLSFAISAVIVISLITWTYFTLLYVEEGADVDQGPQVEQEFNQQETIEIMVVGRQFEWVFIYPNEYRTTGTMRVPKDTKIRLVVTSNDTFHNFGIPEQRVKSDAIPGQRTRTWFVADETGTYRAVCYELCGAAHSYMNAEVVVMEPDEYDQWYANTSAENQTSASNTSAENQTSASTDTAARSTQPVAQA